MDFPTDISQLVGYYVVETLFDLQLLVRSGFLAIHRDALQYTHLLFRDMNDTAVVNPQMFAGLRRITFQQFYHDCTILAQLAPRLEKLDLGSCQHLSSTDTLAQFTKLHTLSMKACYTCSGFYGLRSLRSLHLSYCGPIEGEFNTLEHLSLDFCSIGKITNINPKLQSLEMQRNVPLRSVEMETFEDWFYDLGQLTCLTTLKINEDRFINNLNADKIKRLAHLRHLEMLDSNVTVFNFVRHLKSLRVLSVGSFFDWTTLAHVALESFSSTWTVVSNICCLSTQTGLTFLRLEQPHNVWRDPTSELCKLLPCLTQLRTLELTHWQILLWELPVCPSVTVLSVDDCETCTDDTLAWLVRSFPNVEALNVENTKITNAGLSLLSDQLRELRIGACAVTDVSALRRLAHLNFVDLSFCEVERVDMLPRSLKTLKATSCLKIDPNSMLKLRRRRVKIL